MNVGFRDAAHEAPEAPRSVSTSHRREADARAAFLAKFGRVYTLLGAGLTVLFGVLGLIVTRGLWIGSGIAVAWMLAGLILSAVAKRRTRAELAIVRDGTEAPGTVVDIHRNTHLTQNGRHPWRVTYEFPSADGRAVRGSVHLWDVEAPSVKVGDRVVVLYEPRRPTRSVLWSHLADPPNDASSTADAQRSEPAATNVRVAVDASRSSAAEEVAAIGDDVRGETRRM